MTAKTPALSWSDLNALGRKLASDAVTDLRRSGDLPAFSRAASDALAKPEGVRVGFLFALGQALG